MNDLVEKYREKRKELYVAFVDWKTPMKSVNWIYVINVEFKSTWLGIRRVYVIKVWYA